MVRLNLCIHINIDKDFVTNNFWAFASERIVIFKNSSCCKQETHKSLFNQTLSGAKEEHQVAETQWQCSMVAPTAGSIDCRPTLSVSSRCSVYWI